MWITFLKLFITVISKFDGKPGLSLADFRTIVDVVISVDTSKNMAGEQLSGEEKEEHLHKFIVVRYGLNIARWMAGFVSGAAYVYARNNGLIQRPVPVTSSLTPFTSPENVLYTVPHELRNY